MNNRFLKALCAGLATVVLASPAAVAGLSIEMTNTITVTTTSAVVRLKVVTNDESSAQAWLYWGLTNNGNNATWPNTNAVGAVITGSVYTVSLSGLTAGTTYWATAYATNGATNAWATWQTNFSTLATYTPTTVVVSAYPSGALRGPTNFFAANGISTNAAGDALATSNYIQQVALATTNAIASATQTVAAASLSGTINNARLSGITSNQIDATTDAAYRAGGGGGIDGETGTQIVHNVVDGPFLGVTQAIAAATQTIAGASLSGIIDNARLSGITSNQIDATTDAAYRAGGGGGIDGETGTQIVHNVVDAPFLAGSNYTAAAALSGSNYTAAAALSGSNYTAAAALSGSNYVATAALATSNAIPTTVGAILNTGAVASATWSANAASSTNAESATKADGLSYLLASKTYSMITGECFAAAIAVIPTSTVAEALHALDADTATTANSADSVPAAGVVGTVAEATHAASADTSASADAVLGANVSGTVASAGTSAISTNSLQLGGIAAGTYATNGIQSWGFVDPAPTSAVQNVQWTSYFAATGTVRGIRSKLFSGTTVCDVVKQNWTNALSSYTTVYTGATFNASASNIPFNAAIAVGDMWGVISTNVTTATNWWYSMEWTP